MTVRILVGDCRAMLRDLADESAHCCVTSPPYFGLRDYGHAGQIGLEPTPDAFVAELVAVFREVRRVLRDDGTVWLNLGDSYAGSGRGKGSDTGIGQSARDAAVTKGVGESRVPDVGLHTAAAAAGVIGNAWVPPPKGLKQKDLIGIPWRVAFALQADGWYLRQDIIWAKPNPMPESVRDRCTKSHEYLFLLAKSERYYYDAEAISEAIAESTVERLAQPTLEQQEGSPVPFKTNGNMKAKPPRFGGNKYGTSDDEMHRTKSGNEYEIGSGRRNKRSVWTVTTKPFSGAHFATFPPDLIEPCVLAGCPVGGTVLDPFGGAGTAGLVAERLQRNAVLCELNPEYAAMARARIKDECPMFAEVA